MADDTNLIAWLGGTPFFFEGEDVALRLLSAAKVTGVEMLILEASAGPGASRLFGDHIPTQPLHCNATSR